MSYANRHNDLKSFFHRSDGYISEVSDGYISEVVETVRKHLQSIAFNLQNSFDEAAIYPKLMPNTTSRCRVFGSASNGVLEKL